MPAVLPAWAIDEADCHMGAALLSTEMAATDAWLPPGFHPARSQDVLGAAVPTATALLALTAFSCPQGGGATGLDPAQWLSLSILVDDPKLDATMEPVDHHWYEIASVDQDNERAAVLNVLGWRHEAAVVEFVTPAGGVPSVVGTIQVSNGTGHLLTISAIGLVPHWESVVTSRTWHVAADGRLAIGDMRMSGSVFVGDANCNAAAGSMFDAFVGGIACASVTTQGLMGDNIQLQATWRALPARLGMAS